MLIFFAKKKKCTKFRHSNNEMNIFWRVRKNSRKFMELVHWYCNRRSANPVKKLGGRQKIAEPLVLLSRSKVLWKFDWNKILEFVSDNTILMKYSVVLDAKFIILNSLGVQIEDINWLKIHLLKNGNLLKGKCLCDCWMN